VTDDYNQQFDDTQASHDETDAARLRAEAEASQRDAQRELEAATTDPQRGHPEDVGRHLNDGITDTVQSADYGQRAGKLDEAARLHGAATATFTERDDAHAAAEREDIHAEGAGMVLEFTEDMTEADRTRWVAEKGAAEGSAKALHGRSDELTEQAIDDRNQATRLEDEARGGLPGHSWEEDKYRGTPGGPATDPMNGTPSGDVPTPE
jgi:hypothetical protein